MKYRKKGLRSLGLSLIAVLSLMAAFAAGAQAFENGEYKIEGKSPELTAFSLLHSVKVFRFLGIPLWSCLEHEKWHLSANGSGGGPIEFSACETLVEGCTVAEPIKGSIQSQLIRHKSKLFVRLTPESGTVMFKFTLNGAECALEGVYEVTGSTCGELEVGERVKQKLTFGPSTDKLCSELGATGLKVGKSEAFLEGTATEELLGENEGKKWGGV